MHLFITTNNKPLLYICARSEPEIQREPDSTPPPQSLLENPSTIPNDDVILSIFLFTLNLCVGKTKWKNKVEPTSNAMIIKQLK